MKKEFIPYEQALALKELGFDEPCFAYFNGTTVTRMSDRGTLSINEIQTWRNTFLSYDDGKSVIPNEDDFKQDLIDNSEKYSRHKWGITVSTPLYQQAFRWFREKGVDSELKKIEEGYTFHCFKNQDELSESLLKLFSDDRQKYVYETYEEAELECLKKLIEIVKQ